MPENCVVTNFNSLPQVTSNEKIQPNLQLADLTLREGEQASNSALNVDNKVEIAKALDNVGIKLIQGGHALEDKDALKAYKKLGVKAAIEGLVLCFLPSWKEQIDAVYEENVDTIQLVFRSSDDHLEILKMTRENMIDRVKQGLQYVKKKGTKPITVGLSFASKSDYDYVKQLYHVSIGAGAGTICFNDTTGILKPSAMKYVVSDLKKAFSVPLRVHCHNDFGVGTANTLSAIEAGADIADVSVNGLGERGGHPSMDEVVMALRCLYGVDLGIDISKLYRLAKTVERLTNVGLSASKPIVGKDAFAQKLDAHVLATSQVARSVEPFDPHLVGNERRLVIGRYTGPYGARAKAKQLGITVPESKIQDIVKSINSESVRLKRELSDEDFTKIIQTHSK